MTMRMSSCLFEPNKEFAQTSFGYLRRENKNSFLVSSSTDETIKIWDLEANKCIHTFKGHTDEVRCIKL